MAVGISDDLYREIILDHYRNPRHCGIVEAADVVLDADNPLCGDEVRLSWRVRDGRLAEIAFTAKGCSISQASASMLCDALAGASPAEAEAVAMSFRTMLLGDGSGAALGDLEALSGVRAYPARIKCAILAWNALRDGLAGPARNRSDSP